MPLEVDGPIVDASVLVDMFLTTSPRHTTACELATELRGRDLKAIAPAFVLFEIRSAMERNRIEGTYAVATDGVSVGLFLVEVTEHFVQSYYDQSLPHLKGADLVYLAIALKEDRPLVSEDGPMRKAAVKCGVTAYTGAEYLAHLRGGTT